MSIELIIFDLDGTLVDSCEDITQALNHCLSFRGFLPFSSDEVKSMVGEGVKRLIEKVIERRQISRELFQELLDCFIDYYSDHIADFSKPYPYVKETLAKLNDVKKAVVSNKLTALTRKTLESLSLSQYFHLISGSDSFPEQKPSPLPILKTIEILGVNRSQTLIVGDSELDIKAGKAAEIKTVAVTYGYREREYLRDADYIIDRIDYLVEIVKALSR